MTELGTMMATETWDLVPVPLDAIRFDDAKASIQGGTQSYLTDLANSGKNRFDTHRLWHNQFLCKKSKDSLHLPFHCREGNPFILVQNVMNEKHCDVCTEDIKDSNEFHRYGNKLYKKLEPYMVDSNGVIVGTKSLLNGLAWWTARLFKIKKFLPIMTQEIFVALSNLYDLYICTVFRLCCRDRITESIIFANENRSDQRFNERFPQGLTQPKFKRTQNSSRGNSYGRRKESHQSSSDAKSFQSLVTRFCEADMNAPLPLNLSNVVKAREFITRAQQDLKGIVNLEQIGYWALFRANNSDLEERVFSAKCYEKRVAASCSCLYVACLFESAYHDKSLDVIDEIYADDYNSEIPSSFETYLKQMLDGIVHIHDMCLAIAGSQAINGRKIVVNVSIQNYQLTKINYCVIISPF